MNEEDINWTVGLIDGEGYFSVKIKEEKRKRWMRTGFVVYLEFGIGMSPKEINTLNLVRDVLNVGKVINRPDRPLVEIRITKQEEIVKIIEFFDKHPLKSSKRGNFRIFEQVWEMMKGKEHLTKEGVYKIAQLRDKMNLTYNRKKQPGVRKNYLTANKIKRLLNFLFFISLVQIQERR